MNINQLRAFTSIVEKGTFSAAARNLGISQPAVSLQIQSLEELIGVELLDRKMKKVQVTEAGKLFYETAKQVVSQLDSFQQKLDDIGNSVKGNLAIGGSTIPGAYILPKLLGKFKEKYPEVSVSLRISDTDEIIEQLISGVLHIGVVGAKPVSRHLNSKPFLQDELILIVPKGHEIAATTNTKAPRIKDIAKADFISRERGSGTRQAIEKYLSGHNSSLADFNVAMELGSTEAVINAVSAGLGVSIVSIWAVDKHVKLGELDVVKLPGAPVMRDFYLVESKQVSSRTMQAFTEFASGFDVAGLLLAR
jgi:DNA-binding transcriptional LysR family regulator